VPPGKLPGERGDALPGQGVKTELLDSIAITEPFFLAETDEGPKCLLRREDSRVPDDNCPYFNALKSTVPKLGQLTLSLIEVHQSIWCERYPVMHRLRPLASNPCAAQCLWLAVRITGSGHYKGTGRGECAFSLFWSTSPLLFVVSQIVAEPLVDLLYRLASRCEHRDKLRVGGVLSYPHQLPALLHIPVQEQIEAIPPGVVPSFALIGAAGKKEAKMCGSGAIALASMREKLIPPTSSRSSTSRRSSSIQAERAARASAGISSRARGTFINSNSSCVK
jgi:hypothetical protein